MLFSTLAAGLAFQPQPSISLVPDHLLPAGQHIGRGDVADRAVEADVVEVMDEGLDDVAGLVGIVGLVSSDCFGLAGTMLAFDWTD